MTKLLSFGLIVLLIAGCSKEKEVPVEISTISTLSVTEITTTRATSGGNITNDGGGNIISRGLVWSTSANPTLEQHSGLTAEGSGIGLFTSSLENLTPDITYYVRAYACNSAGISYGNEVVFTTLVAIELPTVTTASITNITQVGATGGGEVTNDGNGTVTVRGVCWSTSVNPTISNSKTTDGTGTGTFVSSITGLAPNTTYHLRAYGTNDSGTGYGDLVTFNTPAPSPGSVTITLNWDIKRYCGANIWWPCWDVVVGLGYNQSEVDQEAYFIHKFLSEPSTFTVTNLAPGTYYYRAKKTVRQGCYLSGDHFCDIPPPVIKSGKFTIFSSVTTKLSVSLTY